MQPLRNDGAHVRSLRDVLLAPRSVALIGQSNDATKTAGRPLKYLRQAGYAGRIYPINARRDEVLGGLGYSQESLVEYCVRRTRGWMIAGGSIEMLKNRIAESVFERRFDQRKS